MHITIQEIKEKANPILKRSDVLRSSVFGSAARGEMTTDSDIDFLVEFPKGKTLLDLVDLKMQLEEAFKNPVDIITYKSIHPLLKNLIRKDEVAIL